MTHENALERTRKKAGGKSTTTEKEKVVGKDKRA